MAGGFSNEDKTSDSRAAREHPDGTARLGIPNGAEGSESGAGKG